MKYLTREELADLYNVSVRTIYNWRQEGMPTVIEKPVRFDLDEVKEWLRLNK